MRIMKRLLIIFLIIIISLVNLSIVDAKTNNKIIFKDQHLFNGLCKYYSWNSNFTQGDAIDLTEKDNMMVLEEAQISDLGGLQYFKKITNLYLGGNKLNNLKPLTKLNYLIMLDISNNLIKGTEFERILETTGRIKNLDWVILNNDGLTNIEFLEQLGEIGTYNGIEMNNNKIVDISVLKNAKNLYSLDLSNNRIQDVSPLANLDKLTFSIDLRDNCIIDYTPIKHLFDEMYKDYDMDNNMSRYDYYTNPFDFKFNGKMIKFPYLTTYYKDQAYAEAKPLFEAFGGSAKYDKKTGKLTCKYHGDTYIFSDFSEKYTINGKSKKMSYPMRRMQYDLAYVPTEDICRILGFTYTVEGPEYDELSYETYGDNAIYKTRLVEITSVTGKELG